MKSLGLPTRVLHDLIGATKLSMAIIPSVPYRTSASPWERTAAPKQSLSEWFSPAAAYNSTLWLLVTSTARQQHTIWTSDFISQVTTFKDISNENKHLKNYFHTSIDFKLLHTSKIIRKKTFSSENAQEMLQYLFWNIKMKPCTFTWNHQLQHLVCCLVVAQTDIKAKPLKDAVETESIHIRSWSLIHSSLRLKSPIVYYDKFSTFWMLHVIHEFIAVKRKTENKDKSREPCKDSDSNQIPSHDYFKQRFLLKILITFQQICVFHFNLPNHAC